MANEITFDKLPQAVGYLTEQVERIHKIVAALQPQTAIDKHRIVEIDEAYKITRKAKPTIYTLARKGLIPAYKRGKKLYFYEDELLQWIESGRKPLQALNLQEQAAEIVLGVTRKPKGGFTLMLSAMNSKLTAEGIMGAAMRMSAELSGGEFPISVFPHKIQRIITELHASQGYPIDYIAAAMLSALAVSIGNSHLAQVKRGWVESPILYMALIGRAGANKSHPLSFAFHPFIEHDYRHNKEYQEQYAEYERTMSMTKKERLEAGKDEFPIPPKRSRFLVSDITPEGLSLIHAQNPRGLCLWSDELSAWFKNFNRYNNGSEEQFWLSVFNAKPTISDRKSSQSSIFIKRPYISVVGTIQQKILGELGKGERASN